MSNKAFFEQQLAIGKSGEAVVKEFLINRGHQIKDVSNDAAYFNKDVDFILTSSLGFNYYVEVKTDYKMNKSNNLFFESYYHKAAGDKKGWFDYTQADYIVFYDVIGNKLYIYDFARGKKFVKEQATFRKFYNNDDRCYRDAYLLPIGKARAAGLLQEFDL